MKPSAWMMYNAMIALARVLPNLVFAKPVNGYVRPVWHGKVLLRGRQRAERNAKKMEAR